MTTTAWNVLVFAVAGNDGERQAVERAVDEMSAALSTDRCNVVVQLHEKAKTTTYRIPRSPEGIQVVEGDEASLAVKLTRFIDAVTDAHQARSTALILWAHGNGVDSLIRGFPLPRSWPRLRLSDFPRGSRVSTRHLERLGPDPNPGSGERWLTNPATREAIARSKQVSVDLLAFNACSMAMLEVAYEMRDVSRFQVASQVLAWPWPYGAIIRSLSARPEQPAEELAAAVVENVRADIIAGKRPDEVAAFRSGEHMARLGEAFDAYAGCIIELIDSVDHWPDVYAAVTTRAQHVSDSFQRDLASFVDVLGKRHPPCAAAAGYVEEKFRNARISIAADTSAHPGVCGLSIFCPTDSLLDVSATYRGMHFAQNRWVHFLTKMLKKLPHGP